MKTQKELIKFGLLAERAHRLAMDIAMQAAQLGTYCQGVAVVADESRNIGTKLHSAFDKLCDGVDINIDEELMELETLSLNGSIEALRINEFERNFKSTKPLAVIFDELRNLLSDINKFLGREMLPYSYNTRVCPQSSILNQRLPFLSMSIGERTFSENLLFVREILRCFDITDGKVNLLTLRGETVKIVDVCGILHLSSKPPKCLVIINAAYGKSDDFIAVPVDELPCIFYNDIGVNAANSADIRSEFIRECWNCEEEQQMIFLNYKKIQDSK